jgi:hypothetical protein
MRRARRSAPSTTSWSPSPVFTGEELGRQVSAKAAK